VLLRRARPRSVDQDDIVSYTETLEDRAPEFPSAPRSGEEAGDESPASSCVPYQGNPGMPCRALFGRLRFSV